MRTASTPSRSGTSRPGLARRPANPSLIPSGTLLLSDFQTASLQRPCLRAAALRCLRKQTPAGGGGRCADDLRSDYFFAAYSSIGLSFGLAQADLVASDRGRFTVTFAGGIGFRNHLSQSLASSPFLICALMLSSTTFLKAASSLRIMMAMGSTLSTSPTILYSAGDLDLAMFEARMEPSITKASARPDSSSRKLSEWSLPYSSLKSMPPARSFLRSVCTDVVPVVVATVLPFRSLMLLMPELALTAMRTSST